MDDRRPLPPEHRLCLGGTTYRIVSHLGRGANALAYRAVYADAALPDQLHPVLLRELFPWRPEGGIRRGEAGGLAVDPQARDFFDLHRESFLRGDRVHLEMRRARAGKVPVNLNTYPAGNTLYTVQEDSAGETLQAVLDRGGPMDPVKLCRWLTALLYSLRAFHEEGLLHLDVSPDNILLLPLDRGRSEAAREVLLIDYNSAWSRRELERREELFLSLKEPWSAPEVRLRDLDRVGPASDLYSVCAVFLACLLCRTPEPGDLGRRGPALGNAPALTGAPATAFHQAGAILRRGLKAPPGQRYQSADELIAALAELEQRLTGGGVTPAALWEASARQLRALPVSAPEDPAPERAAFLQSLEEGGSCLLTGEAGVGKTWTLQALWRRGLAAYRPRDPIPVYLPLYGYDGREGYLHRAILSLLRLPAGEGWTRANHALARLLTDGDAPVLLLLDGVDEAAGDLKPLCRELRGLLAKGGVRAVAAARRSVPQLGLPERTVPPLGRSEVLALLSARDLPAPQGEDALALLQNPAFLALYRPQAGPDALRDGAGLLDAYLRDLVSACRETDGEEAGVRAAFAVEVLLPLLAAGMGEKGWLSPSAACRRVEDCFALLRRRSARRAFPRYLGQTQVLLGDAADGEAWFGAMVRALLAGRLALLWQDGQGNYHLFQRRFQPLLAGRWRPMGRRLALARVRRLLLPLGTAAVCLALGIGWLTARPARPGAYPRTAQEEQTAGQLVNQLLYAAGMTDLQLSAEATLLEGVDDALLRGDEAAWADWLARKDRTLAPVLSLEMPEGLSAALAEDLAGSPVPLEAVEALCGLPARLRPALLERVEALEACLGPGSPYPEADRRRAVRLLEAYLENQQAESFLLLGQVISSLDQEAAQPLLDFLSHASSWRTQLRQADWTGTDYDLGLATCRAEGKELRLELAALGLLPYEEG